MIYKTYSEQLKKIEAIQFDYLVTPWPDKVEGNPESPSGYFFMHTDDCKCAIWNKDYIVKRDCDYQVIRQSDFEQQYEVQS